MLPASWHTIRMDTIRQRDTIIASDIIDRYDNDVYILYEWHLFIRSNYSSFIDNIDVRTKLLMTRINATLLKLLWQTRLKTEKSFTN